MSVSHVSLDQVEEARRQIRETKSPEHPSHSDEQLAMFESHQTLEAKGYEPRPGEYLGFPIRTETSQELWDRKRQESAKSGLAQSVADEGVHAPVVLHNHYRNILDGYHRVAASGSKLFPVTHVGESGPFERNSPTTLRGSDGNYLPLGRP